GHHRLVRALAAVADAEAGSVQRLPHARQPRDVGDQVDESGADDADRRLRERGHPLPGPEDALAGADAREAARELPRAGDGRGGPRRGAVGPPPLERAPPAPGGTVAAQLALELLLGVERRADPAASQVREPRRERRALLDPAPCELLAGHALARLERRD